MRKLALILVTVIIISNLILTPCFAQNSMRKLGRGLANATTGIVEIPKKVILITREEGPALGLTWGWLKGAGIGLLRTAAGIYETLTFPIPTPANFEPVLEPEFVFEEWDTSTVTDTEQ